MAKSGLNSPMVRPLGNGKVPAIAPNTIGTTGVPATQPAQIKFDGSSRKTGGGPGYKYK